MNRQEKPQTAPSPDLRRDNPDGPEGTLTGQGGGEGNAFFEAALSPAAESLLRCCLEKPGAYLDWPFGPDAPVVKAAGHIFAQFGCGRAHDLVTFKCSRAVGEFYRSQFPGLVVRGWHCPPVQQPYWNSMDPEAIPPEELCNMVDHAYRAVTEKLSRKEKERLSAQSSSGGTPPKM